MAEPRPVQPAYSGMKRDLGREAMPPGSLWNEVDMVPDLLSAKMRKRGGWTHGGPSHAGGGYAANGIIAEYSAGQSHLVHLSGGNMYSVDSVTTQTSLGSTGFQSRSAVFYLDMAIFFDQAGIAAPYKVTRAGSIHQLALLQGSPPAGRYGLIYKDVLWNAGSNALPKRIYFSVAGNPQSWDTTNKWLDVSYPITGMAAMANMVLIFGLGRAARIRGSIPPPDTDFVLDDPQFEVGCTDNRSIANYRDKVIWANAQGLWITDGTALEDLTKVCGMKSWWRDVMNGVSGFATGTAYNPSTFTIAGGVYGDYYFYSIHNSTTLVDAGMIDLTSFTWHRLDNAIAGVYYKRAYPEELFFGRRDTTRVGFMSDIFRPGPTNTADGNGNIVEPIIETPWFDMGTDGTKTIQRVYVSYDLRDTLANAPTLQVSYLTSPEATTYTALDPVLSPTGELTREYRMIGIPARGIAFKIVQAGRSDDTRLYTVSLDAQPREGHR